jgi:hypothetical protein
MVWVLQRCFGFGSGNGQAPPEVMFGLDVRPESLPPDVAAAARALLSRGDGRAALSLLFRAALVRLLELRVTLHSSDTEGDCERRVKKQQPNIAGYFSELVSAWQMVAYAHRMPSNETIESLIVGWSRAFPRIAVRVAENKSTTVVTS